jgi:hypothetical protein
MKRELFTKFAVEKQKSLKDVKSELGKERRKGEKQVNRKHNAKASKGRKFFFHFNYLNESIL